MRIDLRTLGAVLVATVLLTQSAAAQERRVRIVGDDGPTQERVTIGGTEYVWIEVLLRSLGFDWTLRGNELVLREGTGQGPRIGVEELWIRLGDRSMDVFGVRRRDRVYVPMRRVASHLGMRVESDDLAQTPNLVSGHQPAAEQTGAGREGRRPLRVRGQRPAPNRAVNPEVQAAALPSVPLTSLAPAPLAARHGLTGADFQSTFDRLTAEGYRLVQIGGYSVGGQVRFTGIWEKRSGPAWRARFGLTSNEYKAEYEKNAAEGYRLLQVSGYAAGNQARYAAIWEKSAGPPRVVRHGLASAEYKAQFDHWTGQGYRPVLVNGYGVGNTAYFEAIWERSSGPAWSARHYMTPAQFQSEFDKHAAEGYRLTHVSPYNVGGQVRFEALFEKRGGPTWVARSGMTSRGYQAEYTDRSLQGYRLTSVAGYSSGGSARYAAIWEAVPGALTGRYCANGKCFDLERFADNIEQALADEVAVKYGFEVRRGISVIRRASGPKRTAVDPPSADFTVFDRFNPASVSKTVTAVAVLQLLARRGISVDSEIHPHLPSGWNVPASSRTITFREVLNHRSGLRTEGAGGYAYEHVKAVVEAGIDLDDKFYEYENINYALLRILVASLDGLMQWTVQPGPLSSAHFTTYVNREIFSPLGIADVKYKPQANAPTLFYRWPPDLAKGTTYGDFSNMPGHAGAHTSLHELAVFAVGTFTGKLLSDSMLDVMKQHRLGIFNLGDSPDGGRCWGHRGMFPADRNQGAHLESALVHCDGGVATTMMINGEVNAINVVLAAYDAAFVPE